MDNTRRDLLARDKSCALLALACESGFYHKDTKTQKRIIRFCLTLCLRVFVVNPDYASAKLTWCGSRHETEGFREVTTTQVANTRSDLRHREICFGEQQLRSRGSDTGEIVVRCGAGKLLE